MKTKISREELIDKEARQIARDKIERQLTVENLPLPKDSILDLHINQLLKADPRILAEAERNVEARTDAYTTSLQSLGLIDPPLDVEIQL